MGKSGNKASSVSASSGNDANASALADLQGTRPNVTPMFLVQGVPTRSCASLETRQALSLHPGLMLPKCPPLLIMTCSKASQISWQRYHKSQETRQALFLHPASSMPMCLLLLTCLEASQRPYSAITQLMPGGHLVYHKSGVELMHQKRHQMKHDASDVEICMTSMCRS